MRLDGFFITIDNSSTISKIALGAILGMALSAVIAVALRMFGSKNDGQPPSSHSSAPPEQPKPLSERKVIFWCGTDQLLCDDEIISLEICQNLQDRIPNVQVEKRQFLVVDDSDQKAHCLYLKMELVGERHDMVDTLAEKAIQVAKGNCVWICISRNLSTNWYFPDAHIAMSGINGVKSQDDNIVINSKYDVNKQFQKSFTYQKKLVEDIIQVVQKMGWPTK